MSPWDDLEFWCSTPICAGTFFVAQAIARGMVKHRYVAASSTSASVTSVFGYAGLAPYGASRGGVRQLTMSLADDWGPHGITPSTALRRDGFRTAQNQVLYEKSGVGRLSRRSHSCEATWRRPRSRWRYRLSRLRIQPLHHRPGRCW